MPFVVEVADAFHGQTEIKIKNSNGVRIGFCQIDSSCMDDELKADLKRWRERHPGKPLLTIIPASFGIEAG